MNKVLEFLNGKKTYIAAGLIAVGAFMVSVGWVIPEWVFMLLGAAGFASVRSAIEKLK